MNDLEGDTNFTVSFHLKQMKQREAKRKVTESQEGVVRV